MGFTPEHRGAADVMLSHVLNTSCGREAAIDLANRIKAERVLLQPRLEFGPDGVTVLQPGIALTGDGSSQAQRASEAQAARMSAAANRAIAGDLSLAQPVRSEPVQWRLGDPRRAGRQAGSLHLAGNAGEACASFTPETLRAPRPVCGWQWRVGRPRCRPAETGVRPPYRAPGTFPSRVRRQRDDQDLRRPSGPAGQASPCQSPCSTRSSEPCAAYGGSAGSWPGGPAPGTSRGPSRS